MEEVKQAVRITRSETVIFDAELTPAQLRNLERALGNPGAAAEDTVARCAVFFFWGGGRSELLLQKNI